MRHVLRSSGTTLVYAGALGRAHAEVDYTDWTDPFDAQRLASKVFNVRFDASRHLLHPTMLGVRLRLSVGAHPLRLEAMPSLRFAVIGFFRDDWFAIVVQGTNGLEIWVASIDGTAHRVDSAHLNGFATVGSGRAPAGWLHHTPRLLMCTVAAGSRRQRQTPDVLECHKGRERARTSDGDRYLALLLTQLEIVDAVTGASARVGKPVHLEQVWISPDDTCLLVSRFERDRGEPGSLLRRVEVWTLNGDVLRTLSVERVPLDPRRRQQIRSSVCAWHWAPSAPPVVRWLARVSDRRTQIMQWVGADAAPVVLAEVGGHVQQIASTENATAVVERLVGGSTSADAISPRGNVQPLWNTPGGDRRKLVRLLPHLELVAEHEGSIFSLCHSGNRWRVSRHALVSGDEAILLDGDASRDDVIVGAFADAARTCLASVASRRAPPSPSRSFVFLNRTPPHPTAPACPTQDVVFGRGETRGRARVYLPASPGPVPTLIWAYPGADLDSVSSSRVRGRDVTTLTAKGYAVAIPDLTPRADGGRRANDTFVRRMCESLDDLVRALTASGVAESGRIAIGGQSYGAALAVIALAHTDLFAAGIARSGCYNRTLSPFGFQDEPRTLWEAPELYWSLSPLMYAERITAPLLLLHGRGDENSATAPEQSVALYHALRHFGRTARCVLFPHEGHTLSSLRGATRGLVEIARWLDAHVAGRESAGVHSVVPVTQTSTEASCRIKVRSSV